MLVVWLLYFVFIKFLRYSLVVLIFVRLWVGGGRWRVGFCWVRCFLGLGLGVWVAFV